MNKLRQGLVVSTIATLSLFAQVNKAIASVLNKDKTNHNTEDLVKITDNTASAISINFDNNANITPPDSTQIKAFFMDWDILTNDEKKDFIELRDNATQSDIRNFYEQQIVKFFDPIFDNEEKKMFIVLLIDSTQNTKLWQTEFEKIKNNKLYKNIHIQSLENMKSEINLAQSIKEWEQLKQEWEQLKQEWEQLKKDGEKLRSINQSLDEMKKAFEENQKKE